MGGVFFSFPGRLYYESGPHSGELRRRLLELSSGREGEFLQLEAREGNE
jgi:hypothetical protein